MILTISEEDRYTYSDRTLCTQ